MQRLCAKLLLSSLFLLCVSAFGQATTGAVSGRVTDPSGAVIPDAGVELVNVDTGIKTLTRTTGEGDFVETALPPGHYTITVSHAGFKNASVSAFKLDIDQKARFNVKMSIGETTEVTVLDETPTLQMQGAETGQVIDRRQIEDLPLNGRNALDLSLLIPGVIRGGGGNNVNLSVNGQREFGNSIQVNGVEVSGNRNNDTSVRPSPDALQEFKIVTSSYAPEFGRASGGAILMQTKSGTNNIHGSVYEFYRPTATAANSRFAPAGSSPTLTQHNYGATIGGPIHRDKAFLFLAYEGVRNKDQVAYLNVTPTKNQVVFRANGDADLSGLKDPYTGNTIPIFDPNFFLQNYYVQQFPGNVIPAAEISPAGKKILQQLFPAPQNNSFFQNYASVYPTTYNSNIANLRTDYTFSQSHRVYLTYDAQQFASSVGDPYGAGIAIKGGGGADTGDLTGTENHVIGLVHDWTITPSLLNEARVNYFISVVTQKSLVDGTRLADQFGIQNANVNGFSDTYGFPQIQFETGAITGGSTYKPLKFRDKNTSFFDSVTYAHGKHNAKFGYEYRHLNSHPDFSLFPVPYMYFGGSYAAVTSDPFYCNYSYDPTCGSSQLPYGFYDGNAYYGTGGSEIADLLLGYPLVVDQGLQLTNPSTIANEHTFYLQDYWQLTPRFNVTYGLRYEYQQPYYDENNNASNFDIATLRVNLAGRGGNSRSLVNSNLTNFMPRVGFAYQLTPTMVLRAGYGKFYSPENDAKEDILTKNYPFFVQQQFYNSPYYDYYISYGLDKGVPRQTQIVIPSGASSIDLSSIPSASSQTVYSEPTVFPTANTQDYNVTLQKELGRHMSVEVSYVGANARDLSYSVGDYNVNKTLSSKIGKVQRLQPSGLSNYNSLQAKVTRNFYNGYSILASYTYGHNLDNGPAPFNLGKGGNYPQNPFNLASEYSRSDSDVRHNFVASQIIELPFGHGKRFLRDAHGIGQVLLGGWQLNSITVLHTGTPFNIVSNQNDNNYPGLRPNLTGDPGVAHKTLTAYFNTAAFKVPTGQSTSTGAGKTLIVGNSPRNPLYGPGYTQEDVSLFKVLTLPREMKLQIRVEAFNALNTPHYYNPNGNLAAGKNFGSITGASGSRVMQFAGRLTF